MGRILRWESLQLCQSLVNGLYRGGVGVAIGDPPALSKAVAPMSVRFCGVLETPLKVLEMLKLFKVCTICFERPEASP